jgi:hypothetical protein
VCAEYGITRTDNPPLQSEQANVLNAKFVLDDANYHTEPIVRIQLGYFTGLQLHSLQFTIKESYDYFPEFTFRASEASENILSLPGIE